MNSQYEFGIDKSVQSRHNLETFTHSVMIPFGDYALPNIRKLPEIQNLDMKWNLFSRVWRARPISILMQFFAIPKRLYGTRQQNKKNVQKPKVRLKLVCSKAFLSCLVQMIWKYSRHSSPGHFWKINDHCFEVSGCRFNFAESYMKFKPK